MDMAEAGEASGMAVQRLEKATSVSFTAASKQWECNQNGKIPQNGTSKLVSALGYGRSRVERTVRQQVHEVTQVQQTINRMGRMLEPQAVREEV
jgi:hypothetical protein